MRRLSSSTTGFYKRVFPLLWLGFLLLIFASGVASRVVPQYFVDSPPGTGLLWIPPLLAVIGWMAFRRLLFDLVDEVWLDGDALVIRNGDTQERIALTVVAQVDANVRMHPRRITLALQVRSRFGRAISFIPVGARLVSSLSPSTPVADELGARVAALRTGQP